MTKDITEPSENSDHDQAEEKTQPLTVPPAQSFLVHSTQVQVGENSVTIVRRTQKYIVSGITNGNEEPTTVERLGQLYCSTCEKPCGLTGQPALERFEEKYICSTCKSKAIQAEIKRLKEL